VGRSWVLSGLVLLQRFPDRIHSLDDLDTIESERGKG
jgi:hypothetical protein